jgi:transcriptional regulator with XRE-family HTH domain
VSKPAIRPYSRTSRDAVTLLGQLIRRARIERKITAAELAERAGVSRGLVQRIEKGDPGLFDADRTTLANLISANMATLALLPKAVRSAATETRDDF